MGSTGPIPGTTWHDESVADEQRQERPVDDDRTRVQQPVSVTPNYNDDAVDEPATTQRHRPFLPRRERTTTETTSRDA